VSYGRSYRPRAKQDWTVGASVKVGFLTLEVLAKVATPGDGLPDMYVLWNPNTSAIYNFTPHRGLTRHDTVEDASAW
jgi:hypothetical protein